MFNYLELVVDFEGCPRRCGGQGDILAGCVATFLYWFTRKEMSDDLYIFAGAAGCILLKQSSNIAYGKYKRAMVTENIMNELGSSFEHLFDE